MVAPGADLIAVTGFAVAGGRSERMGRDKSALPWGGGDLLGHAIARLSHVTRDVRILCGPEVRYSDRGRPVLADEVAHAGAMAGLLTALRVLPPGGTAVLLAVDLPHASADLLRALAALSDGADAAVPVTDEGAEPLCAAYRASCLAAVESAVAGGRFKMTSFWPDVRVRELGGAELHAFGDPKRLFSNVNTAEDYRRARDSDL